MHARTLALVLAVSFVFLPTSCNLAGPGEGAAPEYPPSAGQGPSRGGGSLTERDMEASPDAVPEAGPRHMMRRTRMSIKVEDFITAGDSVRSFVEEKKGYVARSEQKGETEKKITGTMVVKVPVSVYSESLNFFKGLGKVYEQSEEVEDVTRQVVDLESRLRNAKVLERRILDILNNNVGALADVIEAERELARIRQRIEDITGRVRGLRVKTDYATFTLHLFITRSREAEARTWWGPLWQDLRDLGFVVAGSLGALVTFVVAVIPWIFALWFLAQFLRRRAARRKRPPEKEENG